MDLSNPLANLLSPVEAAALSVLAAVENSLSGRRVHAIARLGSVAGIHRALGRLADTGFVLAESSSHAILYRANRAHVLWHAIEEVLASRTLLEHRISECVAASGIPGLTVALFGSVVRGDARAESDVDILIVHPDASPPAAISGLVDELLDRVPAWTGNYAQVLALSRSRLVGLSESGDPFAVSLRTEHRVIVGSGITPLLKRGSNGKQLLEDSTDRANQNVRPSKGQDHRILDA